MSDRKYNEERYNEMKVEEDDVKNASICDEIADDSLMWNPNEAIYWRKQAIEMMEKHYGNKSIENTAYYDKIVNDFMEQGSYSQAEKWNNKSKKIKRKEKGEYAYETLASELCEMEIYNSQEKFDKVPNVWEHEKISLQKNSDMETAELYNVYLKLLHIWVDYKIYTKEELDTIDAMIEIADKAIDLAQKVYGELNMETAEAYRRKALILYRDDGKEENKAYLHNLSLGGNNWKGERRLC